MGAIGVGEGGTAEGASVLEVVELVDLETFGGSSSSVMALYVKDTRRTGV